MQREKSLESALAWRKQFTLQWGYVTGEPILRGFAISLEREARSMGDPLKEDTADLFSSA